MHSVLSLGLQSVRSLADLSDFLVPEAKAMGSTLGHPSYTPSSFFHGKIYIHSGLLMMMRMMMIVITIGQARPD